MARAGLALGGVALIGAGVAIGLGWWWTSTAEATERISEDVHTVKIANDSGDVTIRAGKVPETTVRQHFEYSWGEPEQGYSLSGATLVLGDCGAWCSVDYTVTVPLGTGVTGSLDSGDLRITGVASVDVAVDSGDVRISEVSGPVAIDTDSGDVRLTGIAGPVRAQVDSGDLTITLTEPADVHAEVDSGDVELTVPRTRYHVLGSTDSGDRDIDVPRDPGSRYELELSTDSGDVSVDVLG